ncbi:MAG: hypothetical protein HPY60_10675 [Candidatus Methanofastidiosum sp.]|nr:hypothetical protein [Methanofastidiosum sp.]
MEDIKQFLIEYIWEGKTINSFENWFYNQDSEKMELLLGKEIYLELISLNFKETTIQLLKKQIKSFLNQEIIEEFENEFRKREKAIKGMCIKNTALDYDGISIRDWEVEVGRQYEFIFIRLNLKNKNHSSYVNYVDRENDFSPSGFVPMELFDIDLNTISDLYQKSENKDAEIIIEPFEWTKTKYKPTRYSFWEDFYDDDEKAIKTYFETINKLGIKNVW